MLHHLLVNIVQISEVQNIFFTLVIKVLGDFHLNAAIVAIGAIREEVCHERVQRLHLRHRDRVRLRISVVHVLVSLSESLLLVEPSELFQNLIL